MANWKKIIVSGSGAHLASVTASNLTDNRLLVGGTNGLIENSAITFDGTSLTGVTNFTNSGAVGDSSFTGSFTGSFSGDGSSLTGVGLDIDNLGDTGVTNSSVANSDLFVFSDNGTEKKITYSQLYANVFGEVSGDATISTAGVLSIGSTQIEGSMLSSSVADGTTIELSSGTLSVLKVPNALTAGSGLTAAGTFDGSTARTFSVNSGSLMPFISSSVFSTVSGDITINSAGVAAIAANSVDGSQLEDSITIAQDLVVSGDLTVSGTTTTLNTTNLLVEDKFILLNSGSANPDEGGIIIDQGGLSGSAFIYDAGDTRWGFNASVAQNASTANNEAYVSQVIDENNSAHIGSVSASYVANGNIRIATNGDIFIYS